MRIVLEIISIKVVQDLPASLFPRCITVSDCLRSGAQRRLSYCSFVVRGDLYMNGH